MCSCPGLSALPSCSSLDAGVFPPAPAGPEQVIAHPAHAQALATPDILIPRDQVLFF